MNKSYYSIYIVNNTKITLTKIAYTYSILLENMSRTPYAILNIVLNCWLIN